MTAYTMIEIERPAEGVGLIRLNRPGALNALNHRVEAEVIRAARVFDTDPEVGAIVVTGSERAFAAGADIAEMVSLTPEAAKARKLLAGWDSLSEIRKPIIAAVSGYALGGGCELAMLCDLVMSSDTARFGQPEITLGILPGLGGTQRLTRAIGKAKAMDLCLTGRTLTAEEAERVGLVSRVVPAADLMEETLAVAQLIARMSRPASRAVKRAVNEAFESTLAEGIRHEREAFFGRFGTHDQREGMNAFLEKRTPRFSDT
ncbi:enoyl-CoA hydratase-related protein [Mycobacterium sp. 21AC1]|uniref:enoyl-CoA hydratase-related protein n=1 Tax=[Mycobacterium] appelbergii TaxID=2939269 RepID=UPI002938FEFA|nr:enoyl-CoA hydratase-related protein [Mycobacterium sp. 21AC1]MDV3127300.1 enoyl-CoA hydratase-related protein [Mycobacterium sp. 21AC1]